MNNIDISLWQYFLLGLGFYTDVVDGVFGDPTIDATKQFQASVGLTADGKVGPATLKAAKSQGFDNNDAGVWPAVPDFTPLTSNEQRGRIFGTFAFTPDPSPANPEGVRINSLWLAQHLGIVEIPQLVGKVGAPRAGMVTFHRNGLEQLKELWAAWETDGLLDLVLSWAGSWVPRFVRGSRSTLSNHAWGTAFDINAQWNGLGVAPAKVGMKGSVMKLVPRANEFGFYWGGHYPSRPDGMHFELARIQ
jgi:hypothetical protein